VQDDCIIAGYAANVQTKRGMAKSDLIGIAVAAAA
jgi:hypothetical protein